ncbi:nucleotidyltransferase domain-containing protein [Candidatus Woesearchaeota archaeon]|nr:nucleotidyltransferase domain-containing protein [Candidatus Woesearchaeota archaeon]
MIHNKRFLILKQFLGNYAAEIYGRLLAGKIPLSHKAIALALAELEGENILKSRSQGNIKYYRLNLEFSEVKEAIMLAEVTQKMEFMAKHRKLAHTFREDDRVVGIFGSYARGAQKEDSDVDVFILGEKKSKDYDEKGRLFDLDISIKYFSLDEWAALLKEKNSLVKEIIRAHVVIFSVERFVNTLWRDYYGFN